MAVWAGSVNAVNAVNAVNCSQTATGTTTGQFWAHDNLWRDSLIAMRPFLHAGHGRPLSLVVQAAVVPDFLAALAQVLRVVLLAVDQLAVLGFLQRPLLVGVHVDEAQLALLPRVGPGVAWEGEGRRTVAGWGGRLVYVRGWMGDLHPCACMRFGLRGAS